MMMMPSLPPSKLNSLLSAVMNSTIVQFSYYEYRIIVDDVDDAFPQLLSALRRCNAA